MLTLATALGVSGAAGAQQADRATTGSAPVGDVEFPVIIETTFGPVTIDEEPVRIVATGWGDAETALALGVQPVGASDWLAFGGDGVGPWAEGLYEESPEILGTMELSLEAIADLDPDVILDVKSSGEQDRYDALSEIAPTIGPPEGGEQYLVSWQDQVRMIAAVTGRSSQGEELIDEIDAQFVAAAAEHPEFDGATVTVGNRTASGYGAHVSGSGRVDLMELLGFVNNPEVENLRDDGFSVEIATERLDLLDADLVLMTPIGIEASEITDDPLFQAVPAVQDGRVVVLDDDTLAAALSTNTVLSIAYALDTLVPIFADALDGTSP